jgi:hypothetical protein
MDTEHLIRFRKRLRKTELSPMLIEVLTTEIKRRDAAHMDHYTDVIRELERTGENAGVTK